MGLWNVTQIFMSENPVNEWNFVLLPESSLLKWTSCRTSVLKCSKGLKENGVAVETWQQKYWSQDASEKQKLLLKLFYTMKQPCSSQSASGQMRKLLFLSRTYIERCFALICSISRIFVTLNILSFCCYCCCSCCCCCCCLGPHMELLNYDISITTMYFRLMTAML